MYDLLKGLKGVRIIPTLEKQKLENHEAPMMVGSIPEGFRPSGFKAIWTYTEMNIMIGFHRLVKAGEGTSQGSIEIHTAYKRRSQPWDMGGSYMDLEDTPFDGPFDESVGNIG